MGGSASVPPSPNKFAVKLAPEVFAIFFKVEQECGEKEYTKEETYRILNEIYKAYSKSENKSRFVRDFKVSDILERTHSEHSTSAELLSHIIQTCLTLKFEELMEDTEPNEFVGLNRANGKLLKEYKCNILHCKPTKKYTVQMLNTAITMKFQSKCNQITLHEDVAAAQENWKNFMAETLNENVFTFYTNITKQLCFISNDIKLLYTGTTLLSNNGYSCNVDIRIYLHTVTQTLEIIPHLLETKKEEKVPVPKTALQEMYDAGRSASERTFRPQNPRKVPEPPEFFFIPLPRIYVDYKAIESAVLGA